MASLPYPHRHEYTSRLSGGNHTDNMRVQPIEWVWQGCHTLLQIPILLFLKNLFFCSSVFSKTTCSHVLLSFQTTTCSHVLMSSKQKPVLLFFCLFKQQHVLMSSKQKHVLMFSCLSKTTCSSVFPPKRAISSIQSCLYVAKKNG